MKTLLSELFLSSQILLEEYFKNRFNDIKYSDFIFLEAHKRDTYQPDYIYKNVIDDFISDKDLNGLIFDTLDEISNLTIFRGDTIYIQNSEFEKWQNLILRVSPLLIISYAIFKKSNQSFRINTISLIQNIFAKTALPSIYEPQLDYIIEKDGLNEMHMHLNGATEPYIVWQDALLKPSKIYSYITKSLKTDSIKEQYLQIGEFKQDDLYRLLKIASQIRDKMLLIIYNKDEKIESFDIDSFDISKTIYYASLKHPISLIENMNCNSQIEYEALFFIKSFEYLQTTDNRYFAYLFHYYILIYTLFHKLLVQQKEQVGFDQFQKITINELRELTEEEYKNRYYQLQGMYKNSLSTLEGRFAPKNNFKKSMKLLKSIKKGYDKELQKEFDLKLVAHFIKEKDSRKVENIITFRDLRLRLRNRKTLEVLLNSIRYYKDLIVGFDVAGNELHSSPEAFSPIFRKLAFLGYKNFTYHAGEDFIHILSGMRMVYEAIEFLEMESGNRIGHSTALGIEPSLWKQRLYNNKLTIKIGEWLDNLVFAYHLCIENKIMQDYLGILEFEIQKYFKKIYTLDKSYTIYQIIKAWQIRKYDPFIAFNWREPTIFEDFDKIELEKIEEIKKDDNNIFELFESYHESRFIKNYNQFIEIEPFELFDENKLRIFQNSMLEILIKKNIAIETLPTSNVRISFYKTYQEHHIIRWLGLTKEYDPKPIVVVGSDDTGIFMTNLRNEYVNIFNILKNINSNNFVALNQIELLKQNGKAFSFKN